MSWVLHWAGGPTITYADDLAVKWAIRKGVQEIPDSGNVQAVLDKLLKDSMENSLSFGMPGYFMATRIEDK